MLPTASADYYRDQQKVLGVVLTEAQRIWGSQAPADFDAWFDSRVDDLVALATAGQRRAVAGADQYTADVLEELGTPVAPVAEIATAGLVGVASDGRPLDSLMYGAVISAKSAIAQSEAPSSYATSQQAWMEQGLHALLVRMQVQVADAARVANGLAIVTRPDIGYVRMINPPACSRCTLLAGRHYKWNDGFDRHPQCFPAGVIVSGPSLEASTRRWFEGELVVLTTASGQNLSLTGNHPILTRRGWVPANLLEEGDEVVRSTRAQGATPLVVPDHNQVPALIEDVWGSFAVNGFRRVPTSSEDFHGDGQHGEVDIVHSDGSLRDRGYASLFEHGVEEFFACRSESARPFVQKSSSELVNLWNASQSGGAIGGRSLSLPIGLRHSGGATEAGLLVAPNIDVGVDEALADHLAGNAVLPGQGVLAGSSLVGRDNLRVRELDGTRWDAPAMPFSMESRAGYASRGQELFDRLAGQVELDRVVVLQRVEWSGHVYSLSSSEGWHTANSLIVSNCDCRHIPSREDTADSLTTDPDRYFRSLSGAKQDKVFTKAGAQAIRDGADINQVVNARRGMSTAQQNIAGWIPQGRLTTRNVYGQQIETTDEGVTRRGVAYEAMSKAGYAQRSTDVRTNRRNFQARAPRLMPESIYKIAEDRDDALRLLRLNGYITDRTARPSAASSSQAQKVTPSPERIATASGGGGQPPIPPVAPQALAGESPDYEPDSDGRPIPFTRDQRPVVNQKLRTHILDGDDDGGGHRAGTGSESKSEFPPTWDDKRILDTVDRVLEQPAIVHPYSGRLDFVAEIDDVITVVQVRMKKRKPRMITAYPHSGAGVIRNQGKNRVDIPIDRDILTERPKLRRQP